MKDQTLTLNQTPKVNKSLNFKLITNPTYLKPMHILKIQVIVLLQLQFLMGFYTKGDSNMDRLHKGTELEDKVLELEIKLQKSVSKETNPLATLQYYMNQLSIIIVQIQAIMMVTTRKFQNFKSKLIILLIKKQYIKILSKFQDRENMAKLS